MPRKDSARTPSAPPQGETLADRGETTAQIAARFDIDIYTPEQWELVATSRRRAARRIADAHARW